MLLGVFVSSSWSCKCGHMGLQGKVQNEVKKLSPDLKGLSPRFSSSSHYMFSLYVLLHKAFLLAGEQDCEPTKPAPSGSSQGGLDNTLYPTLEMESRVLNTLGTHTIAANLPGPSGPLTLEPSGVTNYPNKISNIPIPNYYFLKNFVCLLAFKTGSLCAALAGLEFPL